MVDLTSLKAPGWQRVVAELSAAAPDDRAFMLRMLSVLGQVSGARQAVLFDVPAHTDVDQAGPDPRPDLVWPLTVAGDDPESRAAAVEAALDMSRQVDQRTIEHLKEAKDAARAAAGTRQVRAFGLGGDDQFYDGSQGGSASVIAVPVPGGLAHEAGSAPLRGVITLYVDNRSRQALQTTLAIVEVLAGYVFTHATNLALRRTKQAGESLELASRLIASVNTTTGFKACAMQLVNDLSRQLALDRVALGWVTGREGSRQTVRVVSLSDTENLDRRMAMVQKIEGAMEECLDQRQPVAFPPPPESGDEADAVLSRAITHAHRELAAGDARLRVASFPLRVSDKDGERVVGVLLAETSGSPADRVGGGRLDGATMQLVQAAADLLSPVLLVRQSDDRNLALRAKDSAVKAGAWLVGPTHTVWKLAGTALVIATLVSIFVKATYRVGAPMEIRPREPRMVSVPFDGVLYRIAEGIESGKRVERDQVLAELDTTQLKLAELEARAQVLQSQKEADEAMKKNDVAAAQQALARAEQASARADRYSQQLAQAVIRAPISGTIISPDIKDKIKAALKLGEPLFQIADLGDLVAVARVEDRDIAMVRVDQLGEISPKSNPSLAIPVRVEQIVPLAEPKDGVNRFEVRAALTPEAADRSKYVEYLRPGVEGQARLNAERKPLIWIASRRLIDQLRIWLWW